MRSAQVNRAVLAQRALAAGRTNIRTAPLPVTVVQPAGAVGGRRNRVHYSGSSTGGYSSEWSVSQSYSTRVTIDPRWDQTVNNGSSAPLCRNAAKGSVR